MSSVHGLAGMAAIMASTYKAYLGEGPGPPVLADQVQDPAPWQGAALQQAPRLEHLRTACMQQSQTHSWRHGTELAFRHPMISCSLQLG